jgi:hypothetical protein
MSFEPHYINSFMILIGILIICGLFGYHLAVLFMDSLNNDDTIMNDPYVKLPKRRRRRNRSF